MVGVGNHVFLPAKGTGKVMAFELVAEGADRVMARKTWDVPGSRVDSSPAVVDDHCFRFRKGGTVVNWRTGRLMPDPVNFTIHFGGAGLARRGAVCDSCPRIRGFRRTDAMGRNTRQLLLPLLAMLAVPAAVRGDGPAAPFVRREGAHFMLGRQRLYYMGANCFYLAYFAQDTGPAVGGRTWRQMSDEVLARCRGLGLRVIRVWAFNEDNKQEFSAPHGEWRMRTAPGVYREEALAGLDYVMDAAARLELLVVLTLVNNWDDYGGMNWYVDHSPAAATHDDFYTDASCRQWYRDHFATLAARTNTLNGRVYRDDPALFAWQLANEPHCGSSAVLTNWVHEMSAYIKSVDTNHLVSTGEEGWGGEWAQNAACPHIDYAVIHCWPDWWWPTAGDAAMYNNAMQWVGNHLALTVQSVGKPFVLSEYGRRHPDAGGPPLDAPYGRHAYYRGWFDIIHAAALADGPAAGLHFWMLEADGSGHDDGVGSVFPARDPATIALIADHAARMNTVIAPALTRCEADAAGLHLGWTAVVGRPAYRIERSADLATWQTETVVTTNACTLLPAATPGRRFLRIVPQY